MLAKDSASKSKNPPLLDDDFLARLERLSLVSRATVQGKLRGERRSRKRGTSTEFADHRDYVVGDDLRYLDWNIYGRLERLFIKLFHEEEDLTVSLLIDQSASMRTGDPEKFRYACQVAAALAYIALSAEDRVALYPFDSELRRPFPPTRGKRNARRMFRYLQETCDGADRRDPPLTRLTPSLTSFARGRRGRGMIVLISDLLDPEGIDGALRVLSGCRSEVFLIHLLSPQEIDPPLLGDLRLVDCEDGSVAEVSISKNLLETYKSKLEGFREAIRQGCSKRGITPLFASTATPFEQLLLGYLRSRGLIA